MNWTLTVRRAVLYAVLVSVLLPAVGVGTYFGRVFYSEKFDQDVVRALQHDSDVVALGVRESLWAIDSDSASALVEAMMKDSSLVSVEILDPQLGRFVYREQPERRLGKIYTHETDITHQGEVIGRVRVELTDERFRTEFHEQIVTLISVLSLQLLFSVAAILAVLQHRVGTPLLRLTQEAGSLAKGELSTAIMPKRMDEIGQVEQQLEITRQALQGLFHTLEQKNRTLEVDLRERMRVETALRDREQRLRTLVDQSPLAVIEFDLGWHILDWNEAAVRIFGWHREEVLGRHISMLTVASSAGDPFALSAANRIAQYSLAKRQNKRSDGNTIVCQWYDGIIRDNHGNGQRIVAMVEDITERQHADDEIRRLATVVRMTTNLVVLTDADGSIAWFNRAFEERSIPPGEDVRGLALLNLLRGHEEEDSHFAIVRQALEHGTALRETELRCTNAATGAVYWVSMELQPIRNAEGILQQWVVVMTDVTDRHHITDALRNIARIGAGHESRMFFDQLLAVIGKGVDADCAYIALHEQDHIDVSAIWGVMDMTSLLGLHAMERSIGQQVALQGAQVIRSNAHQQLADDAVLGNIPACEAVIVEPIIDSNQHLMGHFALVFGKTPANIEEIQSFAELGSVRAAAELSRQRTLEALRHSEQKFFSIFQHSPIPLALLRQSDGLCVDLNPAFESTFGYYRAALVGRPLLDAPIYASPSHRDLLLTLLQMKDEITSADLQLLTADDDVRDCQMYVRRLSMDKETSYLIAAVDITQLLEAQRQVEELNLTLERRVKERTHDLAETNAELEETLERLRRTLDELVRSEKLAALGSLVAGIAHELNTPIGNSLMVASTLRDVNREFRKQMEAGLRKSILDGYVHEAESAADILVRNLHRAGELITSFKQVAVDQASSQRREFDLAEVISEIVVTMHPVFRKTPFVINSQIPPGIRLDSFPGPMGQVIANLLNNTILHAFEGRSHGQVCLRAQLGEAGNTVILECSDDGVGISPANLKRIFDPFFTTKLGRDGTGLGLNIVHNIVTGILGGSISVHSELELGTTFTITLPTVAPA